MARWRELDLPPVKSVPWQEPSVFLLVKPCPPRRRPAPLSRKSILNSTRTFSPKSEKFTQGQPYNLFARMRAQAPVSWQRESHNGSGFWALTRYEDVMRVDGDPKTFSSQKGGILMAYGTPETRHPLLFRASVDAMINMDAPWHLQLRREHMPYFTPAYLAVLKEKVAAETTRLIDAMADRANATS